MRNKIHLQWLLLMKIQKKTKDLEEIGRKKDLETLEDLNEYNQKLCKQITAHGNSVNILVLFNKVNILLNRCCNNVEVSLIHKDEEI